MVLWARFGARAWGLSSCAQVGGVGEKDLAAFLNNTELDGSLVFSFTKLLTTATYVFSIDALVCVRACVRACTCVCATLDISDDFSQ